MDYAKSLIDKKAGKNAAAAERAGTSGSDEIDDDAEEESWTFVGEADDEDSGMEAALKHSTFLKSMSGPSAEVAKALGSRALVGSSKTTSNVVTLPRSLLANNSSESESGSNSSPTNIRGH